jgi:hypothetical protein
MIDPQTSILQVWFVAPMAAVTMLVLATHLTLLRKAPMPESRRRIRIANGVLMLFATPLIAYVFGVATPATPSAFVVAWTSVAVMLLMMLMLAMLDMLNTARLHRAELRRIRQEALQQGALTGLSDAAQAKLQLAGVYHHADEP